MLQRDVQIFFEDSVLSKDQLQICYGMAHANRSNYFSNSIIPFGSWQNLTDFEYKKLLNTDFPLVRHKTISLLSVPKELFKELDSSPLKHLKTYEQVMGFQRDPAYQRRVYPVVQWLCQHLVTEKDSIINPLKIKQANLVTVSSDLTNGSEKFVGLHVDIWEHKPVGEVVKAPRVMCVNLGNENRYFLFVNLGLEKIFAMLQLKTKKDPADLFLKNRLLDEFIQWYPQYPIVKIQLQPHQAYIAPVENIYHDGSSMGTNSLDISLTVRGYLYSSLKEKANSAY